MYVTSLSYSSFRLCTIEVGSALLHDVYVSKRLRILGGRVCVYTIHICMCCIAATRHVSTVYVSPNFWMPEEKMKMIWMPISLRGTNFSCFACNHLCTCRNYIINLTHISGLHIFFKKGSS
jgi:hypothetical protein